MVSESYIVHVNPAAVRKLVAHIEFLWRINEGAATILYDDYNNALKFLECTPEICPIYIPKIAIDAEFRYKIFGKRYRIVFEIVNSAVFIQDVQDCRQDDDKYIL